MTNPNKPIHRSRVGDLEGAIWQNESASGKFLSVRIGRRYKDKDGKWQLSASFRRHDLPVVEKLVQEVYAEMLKLDQVQPESEDTEATPETAA
ncbi:MAG: hypothetical protein ACKVS8_08860 [Phycisphaerales bacterium]